METTTKSKGLGDTIEKITEATGIKAVVKAIATGIKKVVKAIAGEDCGCDERRDALNKLFPYKKVQPECLEPDEIEYLDSGILRKRTLKYQDRERIATIHARVFNHKFDTLHLLT